MNESMGAGDPPPPPPSLATQRTSRPWPSKTAKRALSGSRMKLRQTRKQSWLALVRASG